MKRLRPYRAGDAAALCALYRRSVETLGPRAYTARQVAAWASLTPAAADFDGWMADGRARVVAEAGDAPLGFCDVERDGHIAMLYCAPEAAGRGVGGALCDAGVGYARGFGAGVVYTEASELARPVFAARGFAATARRQMTVAGVAIHNYAMERPA
ncbi:GNAT family N-acetyltransferase [Rubrimonas cliftonensis]|uniref:Acetyltransferase, GNAT family n=1 Tax=Rubrimonas cliftonensis TaxID=89524 RepID=A0A1H3VI80_9RHOB|nr:GNAT family N-acetyltransferase [Rubrimonas cliftonensis]SDZ73868.1 Acetyltransferase, GNAT family [Rubrimonas cliftonensis]